MAIETMLQVVDQIPESPSGKILHWSLEEDKRAALSQRLADTVVLVTGANRGFGRMLAGTLASAGAAVGLVARSAEQLAETRDELIAGGGTAVAVAADVSDP